MNKTVKLMAGIMAILGGICATSAQEKAFKSLSVAEYEKAIADTSVVRVDVRSAEEYAEGHIAGAINIDVLKDDFEQVALSKLPIGKTIAVNCRSGKRSKNAAEILVKKGYYVIDLDEGFNAWVSAGKPIVK